MCDLERASVHGMAFWSGPGATSSTRNPTWSWDLFRQMRVVTSSHNYNLAGILHFPPYPSESSSSNERRRNAQSLLGSIASISSFTLGKCVGSKDSNSWIRVTDCGSSGFGC